MALRENDLENLVREIFEIDSFKSKMGDDKEICVLTFTVYFEDPASDLENFFEMGYEFVLDADVSPGEMDDGNYRVFVEIERSKHLPEQITQLLDGLENLTGISEFKFRYYKSFRSIYATEENLAKIVPQDADAYERATNEHEMNNFSNFFSNSYSDDVNVVSETITFKRERIDPLQFNIIASGPKRDVYESITGPMLIEGKDIAEVMFLTKVIGNYNINKIGNAFIFENRGWAVALERK